MRGCLLCIPDESVMYVHIAGSFGQFVPLAANLHSRICMISRTLSIQACEASEYSDLDLEVCSGYLNATAWQVVALVICWIGRRCANTLPHVTSLSQNFGLDYDWPEADYTSGSGIAISYSGGGSRAYSGQIGVVLPWHTQNNNHATRVQLNLIWLLCRFGP